MREVLRNKISKLAPAVWQYRALLRSKTSYLNVTGWRESLRRGYPCRPDGSPLPWMNYQIIKLLEDRLTKQMNLFEYGSGYSTIFYSSLVGNVTSVEYDLKWHKKISAMIPSNVDLLHVGADVDGHYCRSIGRFGKFDVVIVDGRDRVNCVKQSLTSLSERGVIVLDDSTRERYKPIVDIATRAGFSAIYFEGIKPTGFELHQSSLFYRPGNCLGL